MTEAQRGLGLSDERAARLVPVSVRTWIRWRQQGRVPIHSLDKVAEILRMEIQRPATDPIELAVNGRPREERWQREIQDEIRRGFEKIDRRLARIEEAQRAASSAREAGRGSG